MWGKRHLSRCTGICDNFQYKMSSKGTATVRDTDETFLGFFLNETADDPVACLNPL